ncbi:uncharacterized protein V1518DRAFT_411590 [Limtongia smithiae]|uniref:uncharacterized protein n=1 Tax=Limtongia smithiae TaxID=1125753 RepID=UPI0034CEDFA9
MAELIKTLTNALPEPIVQLGEYLLGEQCYAVLVRDVAFLTPPFPDAVVPCIKLGISKAIGLAIVGLSAVIKVPQIMKLVQSRSVAGVSVSSVMLEALSYLAMLAYAVRVGFPFSTYGEQAFLFVQDIALIVLILIFSSRVIYAAAFVPLVLLASYQMIIAAPGPTLSALSVMQAASIPLSLMSKVPQIITIVKNKSTGQLSAVAVFAYLGGSLARVFTTIQEVDDKTILIGAVLGVILNIHLGVLMVIYWSSPVSVAKEKKDE